MVRSSRPVRARVSISCCSKIIFSRVTILLPISFFILKYTMQTVQSTMQNSNLHRRYRLRLKKTHPPYIYSCDSDTVTDQRHSALVQAAQLYSRFASSGKLLLGGTSCL
jgi:hypothetical protein